MSYIIKNENTVELGNEYISRVFNIENGQLLPVKTVNKRINGTVELIAGSGSEEFCVNFIKIFGKLEMKASMLTIDKVNTYENEEKSIVEFVFKPAVYKGAQITFRLVYALNNDDFFMKKQLCFSCKGNTSLRIDSVDIERLCLDGNAFDKWSHPNMKKAFLDGFHASLGQPVYANGLFFGSEFPFNDNNIVSDTVRLRYYCGKSLAQLIENKNEHAFHKSVTGSAGGTKYEAVRADFLKYIETVSQSIYPRIQYNSWYDHMLDISDEKIEKSFLNIEKGLTRNGVAPIDSYAVDDGWNDYESDFWSFNKKFPNELYNASALADKLSSNLGLWLGPRGGYDYNKSFARRMEKNGKGGYNKRSGDICISEDNYLRNVEILFLDYMNRFDINYWKLDGFMLKPCSSKRHGHMIGGYKGMYALTDTWEKWLSILHDMRKFRASQGKDLWINLTCYAVPSPWLLHWVNSIWMQNSNDVGFIDKTPSGEELCGRDYDKMLTYRDSLYYDFFNVRQYQLPSSAIYNHDPIYGHTAKINMTDDEYRKYMYMLASRGTAFWELYYSFDMLSEGMFKINADVLGFVKDNFDILKNSKPILSSAEEGEIYGYSAWNETGGIISLRNPSDKQKKVSLRLDEKIGVSEGVNSLSVIRILPYTEKCIDKKLSYNDTLEATLDAHEVVIYKLCSTVKSTPVLKRARFENEKTVILSFDRHMAISESEFMCSGQPIKASLLENYSEIALDIKDACYDGKYTVEYSAYDIYGNILCGKKELVSYRNCVMTCDKERPVELEGDFTLRLTVNTAAKETLLFSQGNSLAVSLTNGNVRLNCCSVKCTGSTNVSDGKDRIITLVRERNSMVKIYVDGVLDASCYDKRSGGMTVPKADIKLSDFAKRFEILNKALAFDEV